MALPPSAQLRHPSLNLETVSLSKSVAVPYAFVGPNYRLREYKYGLVNFGVL